MGLKEYNQKLYYNSPEIVRTLLAKSYMKLPYVIRRGFSFTTEYLDVLRTQRLSRKEIELEKNKKLRCIIDYSYQNSIYYHNIMKKLGLRPHDFKSIDDIKKLPLLTKDMVRNNHNKILTTYYKTFGGGYNKTTGSTGAPIQIYISNKNINVRDACKTRLMTWFGCYPDDKKISLRPVSSHIGGKIELSKYRAYENKLCLSTYNLSDKICEEHTKKIIDFKAKMVIGTPSAIFIVAKYMIKKDITIEGIKGVITSSETLYAHQRKAIEKAFNSKIYDWYGLGESVASCGQCQQGNYHESAELGLFEFIDEGEDVMPGETGEIVLTTLVNKAMPLLRYMPGDIGQPDDIKCECGLELPVIKAIQGKNREIIMGKDGRCIHGEFFTRLIEDMRWIKESQFIQKKNYDIVFKINTDLSNPPKKDLKWIVNNIGNVLKDINVEIDFVGNIYPSTGGKKHFIISEVKK